MDYSKYKGQEFEGQRGDAPRIKIVQAVSKSAAKGDAKVGQFDVAGEEYVDYIEGYIAHGFSSVSWFAKQSEGGEFKGIKIGDVYSCTDYNYCIDHADDGKFSLDYIFVRSNDLHDAVKNGSKLKFYQLSFGGMAYYPAKELNKKLQSNGREGIPVFAQKIKITTEYKDSDAGGSRIPVISYEKLLDNEPALDLLSALSEESRLFYGSDLNTSRRFKAESKHVHQAIAQPVEKTKKIAEPTIEKSVSDELTEDEGYPF